MYRIEMGDPKPIYVAPVNPYTARWGVYAIPKLWQLPGGDFVICFNGMQDSPASPRYLPDLYFRSDDQGENWKQWEGEPDRSILGNVEPSTIVLSDGGMIAIRPKVNPASREHIAPIKRFPIPNSQDDEYWIYRQSDLEGDCFALERVEYAPDGKTLKCEPAYLHTKEREIFFIGYVEGHKAPGGLSFTSCGGSPYLSSICLLPDGTFAALCTGQNPKVQDHFCGEAYLAVSVDGGYHWTVRSNITQNAADYPYGLCGDGLEASLSVGPDQTMYCVTRTNMSVEKPPEEIPTDAMLFVSRDLGYTWEKERPIADNSVTPHILALKNRAVAVIYGRPGVHIILSEDRGKTFQKRIDVIGKTTLREELAQGKSLLEASRFDISYSNSFYVMLDDETFLILYTDMQYDIGDGQKHKAGLVRKIRITEE